MRFCRILGLLASVVTLWACSSSSTTPKSRESGGGVPTLYQYYRLVAINGDTARVFPHGSSGCPSEATKYQWGTLAFTPEGGQPNIPPFVTVAESWYPLCQFGIVPAGGGKVAASYTQGGSALSVTFFPGTTNEAPVTGRISANGAVITLDDMPDFRGADPAWINTAQFTYEACTAGPCR